MAAFALILSGWAFAAWAENAEAPRALSGEEAVPAAMADLEAELGTSVHLPVEVNERVENWMRRLLLNPETMSGSLARAGLYSEMIGAKLAERGMPQELVYLAMIESEFATGARSHVAATGMWQFMSPTARAYGLRVDEHVDERRDPIRATDAALDYLQVLYERYGSWYLAAAAYNAGPTRVSRALRRHADGRSGDEALYWEIIDHLPRETAAFVPKLLAATTLARHPERYGLEFEPLPAYAYDIVWAPGRTRLASVAEGLDVTVERLRYLNPHLVRGETPPEAMYPLRVPVGLASRTVASFSPNARVPGRMADDD